MKNDLKEFMEISDGLVNGYVVIRDGNGKILVQKKNMIVKEGKAALLSRFLTNSNGEFLIDNVIADSTTRGDIETLSKFSLYKVILYKKNDEVSFTDDISLISDGTTNIASDKQTIDRLDFDIGKENTKCELSQDEDGHFIIKLSINISFDNENNAEALDKRELNSLSIIMKDFTTSVATNNNFKMFSRIRFDPIILTPESSLTLQYYVYF